MKKKTSKKGRKSKKRLLLPTKLINDLSLLNLSKVQMDNCIHIIDIVYSLSYKQDKDYYSLVPISSNYFKESIGEGYFKYINILLEKGILVRDNFYTFGKVSKVYSYGINNIYGRSISSNDNGDIYKQYEIDTYYSVVFYFRHTSIPIRTRDRRDYKKCISTLKIDIEKLKNKAIEIVRNISIDDLKTGSDISENTFQVTMLKDGYRKSYITSLDKALETSSKHGLELIQDGRKFYLSEVQSYIERKRNNVYHSLITSIDKLEHKKYYANRNTTNNRLDTNLTNMSSELLDIILKDNNLVQYDLSNSQFAILSYLLPNTNESDLKLFKKLSYTGGLYTYIQEYLSLESRREAKKLTFELLFSSYRNNNILLKELKVLFPTVIDWINDYKKHHGDNQFAIMLQKKESAMFIDNILYSLHDNNTFALSKHDSIICKETDAKEVEQLINNYFDSISFEGTVTSSLELDLNHHTLDLSNDNIKMDIEYQKDNKVAIIPLNGFIESNNDFYNNIDYKQRVG